MSRPVLKNIYGLKKQVRRLYGLGYSSTSARLLPTKRQYNNKSNIFGPANKRGVALLDFLIATKYRRKLEQDAAHHSGPKFMNLSVIKSSIAAMALKIVFVIELWGARRP